MQPSQSRRSADVTRIGFERMKYGRHLLVDACAIDAIPTFIKTPRPHVLNFYEIALITDGHGALNLDGTPLEVAPMRVCITAPGETRSWRLDSTALNGQLAFFEADFVNEFFADPCFVEKLPVMAASAAKRSFALDRRPFDELAGIVGDMHDELRAVQDDSNDVLRAQTHRLLIALQRHGRHAGVAEPIDRARMLAKRFAGLVEQQFMQSERVTHYADLLGVTPRHLNHCVQRAMGVAASAVIHNRLHLEARRLLMHSDLSVAEIADALNFSDPSYFIRVFKRHAGSTPREFRAQHGSPVFSPQRSLRRAQR